MKAEFFDSIKIGNSDWITGIDDDLSAPSEVRLLHSLAIQQAIEAIVLTGSNPGEIYNIKSYGAVGNVGFPLSGNNVTGTNNKTAFDAAIAAAPVNASVFVPSGNYFTTTLNTITSKKLNLFGPGNIYTNGNDFLVFDMPGGAPRCHNIQLLGSIVGRINNITNTRTAFLNSTGPNWGAYAGSAIKVLNDVYGACFRMNFIDGFKNGIEMVVGTGNGSQENTFAVQRINGCANGIHLRSTDGVSWCDHDIFQGPHGGHLHINGCQLGLKIDGFSGAASTNGEIYNGAFRSNQFKFLLSHCTRYIEINGDATDSHFDIVMEGGTNTGVWDTPAIQCRSVSPNFLRSPRWRGRGILNTQWMVNGMGIDGVIEMPVWLNNASYIGCNGNIDSSGNINMRVKPSLPSSTRNALPANIRCMNEPIPRTFRVITTITGSNTATDAGGVVYLNSNPMTFSSASPTTNVGVEFELVNINAAAATVTGITGLTSLAQNKGAKIVCDGSTFRAIINP
jgi:hypothetical protein